LFRRRGKGKTSSPPPGEINGGSTGVRVGGMVRERELSQRKRKKGRWEEVTDCATLKLAGTGRRGGGDAGPARAACACIGKGKRRGYIVSPFCP